VAKVVFEALADAGSQHPQGWQGQSRKGLLKAGVGFAGLASFAIGSEVESASGLETFAEGIAGTPGQEQERQDDGVQGPACGAVFLEVMNSFAIARADQAARRR
jgi:hypothetical protein